MSRVLTDHERDLVDAYGRCPLCSSPLTHRVTIARPEHRATSFLDIRRFTPTPSEPFSVTVDMLCLWNAHGVEKNYPATWTVTNGDPLVRTTS